MTAIMCSETFWQTFPLDILELRLILLSGIKTSDSR